MRIRINLRFSIFVSQQLREVSAKIPSRPPAAVTHSLTRCRLPEPEKRATQRKANMQGRDKSAGRAAKQRNGGHGGEVPKSSQRYEMGSKRVSFDQTNEPPKTGNRLKGQLSAEIKDSPSTNNM